MSDREYDIIAFGATGFTGGLVAEYLARHAPEGVRWAVAGRRESTLRDIVDRLLGTACPPAGLVVADTSEPSSIRAMAAKGRVLLSTVGPFERYGEPVVQACVETGTDYVDITGEPQFVERMIERYHDEAEQKGLKIISCCGFDSIPHDLGVLYTLDHISTDGPLTIEGFVRSAGTFSGGTWHSAVNAMANFREHRNARKRRPRPSASSGRRVRGKKPRVHYEEAIGAWAAPLPTIDPDVVLRSARLSDEYGPDFRYGHYARIENLLTVVGAGIAIGGIFALSQAKPTRELLLKVKDPGEGPDVAKRARSWFRVTFVARAAGQTVLTEVSGGDPGYAETSKMLSESALCLALERAKTPDHFGVVTPATGMGHALIERLQTAGISFRRISS